MAGADLDFFPTGSSLKSYTPGDTTDATGTGAYDVLIKPGTYDIDYKPPAGSPLLPVRRPGVSAPVDVALPDTTLPSGWLLSGSVHAQATGLPVDNVRIEVYPSAGGSLAWTPHNATSLTGTYLFSVDTGTWDLQYVPPTGSGLAPTWRRSVVVSADLNLGDTLLLPPTVPTVTSVTPATGVTRGGDVISIGGTGFHPDAAVRIGGVAATGVSVFSSSSLTAVSAAHPPGAVSVEVINPIDLVGQLPRGYTYLEPASPVSLAVTWSGNDIVLSWQATGQPLYTVFRSGSPTGFSSSSMLGTTSGTAFTDVGGVAVGGIQFYNVD